MEAGVRLDIRDRNHVWCRGVVTRLINRYSEPKKYVKVKIEVTVGKHRGGMVT